MAKRSGATPRARTGVRRRVLRDGAKGFFGRNVTRLCHPRPAMKPLCLAVTALCRIRKPSPEQLRHSASPPRVEAMHHPVSRRGRPIRKDLLRSRCLDDSCALDLNECMTAAPPVDGGITTRSRRAQKRERGLPSTGRTRYDGFPAERGSGRDRGSVSTPESSESSTRLIACDVTYVKKGAHAVGRCGS